MALPDIVMVLPPQINVVVCKFISLEEFFFFFLQFVVIYTVKSCSAVNDEEVDALL